MKGSVVVLLPGGGLELRGWPAWCARLLDEVPVLADPSVTTGAARDRIFPRSTDGAPDAPEHAEWRRNVHPELFALFASAKEIVANDLAGSERTQRGRLRRLTIPAGHVGAWISALQAARLHLGAAFGVDAVAMNAELAHLPAEQRGIVLRINLLAGIQEMLLHDGFEDAADDGGDAPPAEPPPRAAGPAAAAPPEGPPPEA